ncbi:transposase [Shigella flexneri]
MVGLDAGVAKFATLSDGTVFEPVNVFEKPEDAGETFSDSAARSNQQQLAEAETQIQRLHSCIANIRRDYLTKSQRPSAKSRNDSH